MRQYGLPYMGTKTKLAEPIVRLLPRARHFYDLFCGGGAISDRVHETGKFQQIHLNDIMPGQAETVKKLLLGTLEIDNRWVSHEEFFAKRFSDPVIRCIWSFGNSGTSYLYSREIEPWKKAVYYASEFGDNSLLKEMGIDHEPITRAWIRNNTKECRDKYIKWVKPVLGITPDIEKEFESLRKAGKVDTSIGGVCGIKHAESELKKITPNAEKMRSILFIEQINNLEGLQSLESFERLQAVERIQSIIKKRRGYNKPEITATEGDYRNIVIEDDSTIYCDIPYDSCGKYQAGTGIGRFNNDEFWDWCRSVEAPVIVSSYKAPDDFITIAEFTHRSTISDKDNKLVKERCFIYSGREKTYRKLTGWNGVVTDKSGQLDLF